LRSDWEFLSNRYPCRGEAAKRRQVPIGQKKKKLCDLCELERSGWCEINQIITTKFGDEYNPEASGKELKDKRMNRRIFLKSIFYAAGASLAGGSAYALHSMDLQITRQQIPLKGIRQKMRIVALSDLHAPCYYMSTRDLVRTINSQKPDLLILAGDMFGQPGFEKTADEFKRAEAAHAKLAVPGNWEYQLNIDPAALKKAYADAGIGYLVNEIREVGGLKIIGLDDLLHGAPQFKMAGGSRAEASPALVINHCPKAFDSIATIGRNTKIVISGHTHGGQIAPFGHALVTPSGSGRYLKGWYREKNNAMYVMRGIGATHLPLRLGARPELLVLDLLPS
jgi:hypothetical protein